MKASPDRARPLSCTAKGILRILRGSAMGHNDMQSIATYLQAEADGETKSWGGMGRYHLAVSNCARMLAARGLLCEHAGQDQYHPQWYSLTEKGRTCEL